MSKKPEKKKEGFFGKHPPMGEGGSFVGREDARRSSVTVSEAMRAMEKAKAKYHLDVAKVEENLTAYLETSDPILGVVKGKETPILWVRRPSMKEIKELTPTREQMQFMETKNPEDVTSENINLIKEYDERFYNKFAELVVAPQKTPEQWREVMNPWLLRLFWGYIAQIGDILGAEIEGF